MKTKNEVNNYEPNVAKEVTPDKPNKKTNQKFKKILVIVVLFVIIVAICVGGYFIYKNSRKIDLISDIKTIEYGEKYEPNVSDFVDAGKINDTYEITGEMPNENSKEYPAEGEYSFTISARGKDNMNVKVVVQDTVAPEFDETAPSEISTFKDVAIDKETLTNTFNVDDLSPVSLAINDVDYAIVGEYKTNLYATDKNGNVSYKEITVKVLEPTIDFDNTTLNMTVGDMATITATVKGKSQDIEWSSSDESVAKVENGNVTANKAGKVTIKAKANDVEATCEVTIKEKVTNQSNNGSSSKNKPSSNSNNSTKPSSGNSSINTNLSINNSGSNSSNNNGGSASNLNQHTASVGNIGKWFSSKGEIENYWQQIDNKNFSQYENGTITYEEYAKTSPYGYECWSCSHCGKWTGNFKYR